MNEEIEKLKANVRTLTYKIASVRTALATAQQKQYSNGLEKYQQYYINDLKTSLKFLEAEKKQLDNSVTHLTSQKDYSAQASNFCPCDKTLSRLANGNQLSEFLDACILADEDSDALKMVKHFYGVH